MPSGLTGKPPLIIIVGPTAVGKTQTALVLAAALNGEIISGDSRLFYRGMSIGTAKPTPAERAQIPHHLIDTRSPDQPASLAEFHDDVQHLIEAIKGRGRLPLLVGGTGQYVRSVVEGWGVPDVAPQPELRAELEQFAAEHGADALYARLQALDPPAAQRIHPNNIRRVVRALEVTLVSGQPFSAQRAKRPPPYQPVIIGLTRPREELRERINARVDAMIADGLVEEVQALLEAGYGWHLPALSSVGYAQLRPYFEGTASLGEAVESIKRATYELMRKQFMWFRLEDPSINWFDLSQQSAEDVLGFIKGQLTMGG